MKNNLIPIQQTRKSYARVELGEIPEGIQENGGTWQAEGKPMGGRAEHTSQMVKRMQSTSLKTQSSGKPSSASPKQLLKLEAGPGDI